jgi:hypothetical protein
MRWQQRSGNRERFGCDRPLPNYPSRGYLSNNTGLVMVFELVEGAQLT